MKNIIKETDWVVIKPNMVTSRSHKCSYWHDGIAHPGQVTDLRVIKSLIGYLIDNCHPKRITIAEGGAEWKKNDEPGTDPNQTEDGWTVTWPEFDNLSYVGIVEEYEKTYPGLVDIVDLNYRESGKKAPAFMQKATPAFGLARGDSPREISKETLCNIVG